MWYTHDGMGWWMLLGGVFWLLLIVTIAWIAFQLMHRDLGSRGDSLEQVKGRYARGEISREEFQRIVQDLTHVAPDATYDARTLGR
jgi:uncharacterized membrane protein